MSEITVPDPEELIVTIPSLTSPQQMNRSRWTGRRKVIGQPGIEYWTGKAMLADLATEEDERQWRAFLYALGGPANWFRYYVPCNLHDGDKPTVAGGASDGYELPLTGLFPSSTILRAGQFMTVPLPSGRYRAVSLIADLVASGGGTATAQFRPALGETPTGGVTVETLDPFIPMSPVSDTLGLDTVNGVSSTSFDVEESR